MLPGKRWKEFQKMIRRYLRDRATPAEKDLVESYYRYFDDRQPMAEPLSGIEKQELENRLYARLETGLNDKTPARVLPLYARPFTKVAAAAILFLLAGALYLYYSHGNHTTANPIAAIPHIPPGGKKAILTLAGGQQIILDSAGNGVLTKQGNTQINKTVNGQLAYTPGARTGEVLYNMLSTPKGGEYKLILPDGTKAWLNAESSIHYPTAFIGKERKVEIKGEVFFEVAKAAAKPFIVGVNGIAVKVLGTSFDIMAYNDETEIRTTLIDGKVDVTTAHGEALLKPGQQAVITQGQDHIVTKEADTDKETAWMDGFFQMDQTDLPTLMRQLNRWYDVEIVYQTTYNGRLFGGRISRSLDLSEVLPMLEYNKVHCKIEGKKLIIMP